MLSKNYIHVAKVFQKKYCTIPADSEPFVVKAFKVLLVGKDYVSPLYDELC